MPGSGGAGAFLDFLEHQVVPFVDCTILHGAHRPGVARPLVRGPVRADRSTAAALFQRIVAASPAAGWITDGCSSPRPPQADAGSCADSAIVGSDEAFRNDNVAFAKLLDELKPLGLSYRFTIYREKTHSVGWLLFRPGSTGCIAGPTNHDRCASARGIRGHCWSECTRVTLGTFPVRCRSRPASTMRSRATRSGTSWVKSPEPDLTFHTTSVCGGWSSSAWRCGMRLAQAQSARAVSTRESRPARCSRTISAAFCCRTPAFS